MLGHLVSNAPRLIRPYMEPILKVSSTTQCNGVVYYTYLYLEVTAYLEQSEMMMIKMMRVVRMRIRM